MTDHPKVRAGLRSFYKFPRQAPGSDRVEVTRREGGKLGLKSIFSIFILSIIMTLMLSRSFLSVTGYMSPKLLSFIAQSLSLGEFGYYLVTLTIDAASYSIILLLVTTSIMHYTTISVKFRELTESEARLGNLRPLSSDVIARLVEKHDVIADNLNTRVLSLQARATMIYWTILLTLAVGVLLVI